MLEPEIPALEMRAVRGAVLAGKGTPFWPDVSGTVAMLAFSSRLQAFASKSRYFR